MITGWYGRHGSGREGESDPIGGEDANGRDRHDPTSFNAQAQGRRDDVE